MAEGFICKFAGERFEVFSAGTEPAAHVHPLAAKVMANAGIDISGQRPKHLKEFLGRLARALRDRGLRWGRRAMPAGLAGHRGATLLAVR